MTARLSEAGGWVTLAAVVCRSCCMARRCLDRTAWFSTPTVACSSACLTMCVVCVWLCGCVAVWPSVRVCVCVCMCQTGLIALHAWLDRLAWRCGTQQHRSARRKCLSTTPLACSGWTRLRLAVMARLCSRPTGCSSISTSVAVGRVVVLLQVAGAATYASMNV